MESPVLNLYTTKCFLLPQFVGSLFFLFVFFFFKRSSEVWFDKKEKQFCIHL